MPAGKVIAGSPKVIAASGGIPNKIIVGPSGKIISGLPAKFTGAQGNIQIPGIGVPKVVKAATPKISAAAAAGRALPQGQGQVAAVQGQGQLAGAAVQRAAVQHVVAAAPAAPVAVAALAAAPMRTAVNGSSERHRLKYWSALILRLQNVCLV